MMDAEFQRAARGRMGEVGAERASSRSRRRRKRDIRAGPSSSRSPGWAEGGLMMGAPTPGELWVSTANGLYKLSGSGRRQYFGRT
jgi:hypothetical protein